MADSNPIIVNSIVWDNTPQNIYFRAGEGDFQGNITFSYSDLQGGQDSIVTNETGTVTWSDGNNVDIDPLFVDADNGDYHLSDLSPVISAGADSVQIAGTWYVAPTTDIEENPRPSPAGTIPDMGAYEHENGAGDYSGPVWYVDASATLPYANGSAFAKFIKIQFAIDASTSGDTVLVAAGTYTENIDYSGKNLVIISTAGRDSTIIDGASSGSVVLFENGEDSIAVLSGFTIQNGSEGGIYCQGSSPTLKNLIVTNNTNGMGGGGIYCNSNSSPSLENITIINNSATGNSGRGGGMRCNTNSDPSLLNVLISGNTASQEGGGVFIYSSDPSFSNVTISGNLSSTSEGDGIFIKNNSSLNLVNTVLWGNASNELEFASVDDSSSITISYSNIEGGLDSIVTNDNGTVTWGDGNVDIDPLFVDVDNDDYHLLASSQCINGGDPATFDSDGSRADMGSYPYLNTYSGPTWYIAESGNDTTGTGASDDPFSSVQAGINFSSDADSVTVAAGTYVENINFRGRNIKVVGADRETTIIDGDSLGTVVSMAACSNASMLSGFTLQNGAGVNGGGLYLFNSEPVLFNLLITENSASTNGGGIYFDYSNPSLENVTITGNSATVGGGGIYFRYYSSPSLENVIITGNSAGSGGGVYCWLSSNPSLENVTITGNSASYNGGGMYCSSSNPTLTNVTFSGNTALLDGGGMYLNESDPTQINVTISGNTCMQNGGGVFMVNNSNPSFVNSILWNDSPQEIYLTGASDTITVSYSDVQDSIITNDNGTVIWGDGNLDTDPRFVDAENDNYNLLASSQLINAGDPATFDSDGSRADMGAYPYLNSYSGPTWYIAESGNDTTATGASGDPFRSIQAGINFSSDADSVTVAVGTYVENINFRGRNIKVVGADRETTIIDGDSSGSVVVFENPNNEFNQYQDAVLKNFTITNGGGWADGSGIRLRYFSSPTLSDLIITNNTSYQAAGGIECESHVSSKHRKCNRLQ